MSTGLVEMEQQDEMFVPFVALRVQQYVDDGILRSESLRCRYVADRDQL